MASFSTILPRQIRDDCRYYSGYKPCHRFDGCPGCSEHVGRGYRILIIKLGAMGDVLRTKCLLPGLKARWPHSWITWLTTPGSEPIVADPLVDRVLSYSPASLSSLEGQSFDLLLSLDKDHHATTLAARCQARHRMGFAPTAEGAVDVFNAASAYALRLGLSDDLKYHRNLLTVPEILYELAELPYQGEGYRLSISKGAASTAGELIGAKGRRYKHLVGCNLGCGPVFESKAWPAARWIEYLKLMISQGRDVGFVLLGGPREARIITTILDSLSEIERHSVISPGVEHYLECFFALVNECHAVVTADSLGLHVAVALRKQVVALFGPTSAEEIDLFGNGIKIVTLFPCAPCYLKKSPLEVTCMDATASDQVAQATWEVLSRLG